MSNMELFEQYYVREHDTWVKRLTSRCPSVMDAEDVVQEAFTNALTFIDSYNPQLSAIQTWFTCIINRTHAKMKAHEYSTVEISEEDIFTEATDELEANESVYKKVLEDIGGLKDFQHRQILWLYFKVGLKMQDVSRVLDESFHKVKTTIERFKKDMRAKYGRIDESSS